MTVLEFSRGWFVKRFGLAIVLTPTDADGLLAELRGAKLALMGWIGDRGAKARYVKFSVPASAEQLDSYEAILRRVCFEEVDLAPLLASRNITAEFCDFRGKKVLRSVALRVA